ncbi:MAG TPA: hypothetical protein VII09_00910 [Opitutaceae bacterium]
MNTRVPTIPGDAPAPRDRWILAASGFMAMAPYVLHHAQFARLYWFGDEFDLIDRIDVLGFWKWTWLVFAENFVPLFKILWGGAVLVLGGSYGAMITLVWLTHACNVMLLGRLMRTCGLAWGAVLLAQIVFALTSANLETLGWSVQWSAVLAVTFMFLALNGLFRSRLSWAPAGWAAASALSFSRGVITGLLLALGALWPGRDGLGGRLPRRLAFAAACAVPSVVVGALIALLAPSGNQGHMAGHWGDAAVFGSWYYCLNPGLRLLGVESWGPRTVVAMGLVKFALMAWTLARSRGRTRLFFLILFAFDLANAALLGIGRYHTGLGAAVSSRYQYASLIGIMPAAGFLLSEACGRIPGPRALRGAALACLLGLAALGAYRGWSDALEPFTTTRGTDSRSLLLSDQPGGANPVPGFPGFSIVRTRALIAKYHLH